MRVKKRDVHLGFLCHYQEAGEQFLQGAGGKDTLISPALMVSEQINLFMPKSKNIYFEMRSTFAFGVS
ncbi:hypothetical protein F8S12_08000 [Nostoc sp. WHI]|nr:hypothetical protein [Nostoc sp. WHI]